MGCLYKKKFGGKKNADYRSTSLSGIIQLRCLRPPLTKILLFVPANPRYRLKMIASGRPLLFAFFARSNASNRPERQTSQKFDLENKLMAPDKSK